MPAPRSRGIVRLLVFLALAVASTSCTTAVHSAGVAQPGPSEADERAVREIVDHQTRTWNAGDARAHAADLAADVVFTNILGQSFTGADAFVRQHAGIFQGLFRGTTVHQDIIVLRFPTRDVALVETLTAVSGLQSMPPGATPDARGRLRTKLLQVLVRRADGWKIVAYHNVDVKSATPVPEPGVQ